MMPVQKHVVIIARTDGSVEAHPLKQWLREHPEISTGLDPNSSTSHQLRSALKRMGWTMEQSPAEVRLIKPGVDGNVPINQRTTIERRTSPDPAIQNKDRVSRAIELLRDGLIPFVERELQARLGAEWLKRIEAGRERGLARASEGKVAWDSQALLKVMIDNWQGVFRFALRPLERAWVSELLDVRNRFAHEQPFNFEDTHRALDTAQRLLTAVSAPREAAEIDRIKTVLSRSVYGGQR